VNAARTGCHLAEKLAAPHDEDNLDGVETELASALGGAVVISIVVLAVLIVVAYKAVGALL
jgi:hypothetical protein